MVNDIRNRRGGNVLFSRVDSTYLETEYNSPYHDYMANTLLYNSKIVPDLLALDGSCYKVASCNLSGNQEDSIYYKEKYGENYTVVTSGDYWVDMIPKDVDKGTCLRALLERLGIAPDECIAFGDQAFHRLSGKNHEGAPAVFAVGAPPFLQAH